MISSVNDKHPFAVIWQPPAGTVVIDIFLSETMLLDDFRRSQIREKLKQQRVRQRQKFLQAL